MGAARVFDKVYEVLNSHVGLEVPITDIMTKTGLNRHQVINAIHTLRAKGNVVDTPIVGYSYRLVKTAVPTVAGSTGSKRVFEEVGTTKSGAIVIQDEEGNLYKAEEI